MKKLLLSILLVILIIPAESQELRCNVRMSSQKVQGTNRQIFETLESAINEFMNGRAWSNYKFSNNERIECSMLFNINDYSGNYFSGTLQIQVRRPVYNSSYNTVLFNYIDNDIEFRYEEFQSLDFSETTHLSNLTSLMAFYAYIIMGLDFDSYGLETGKEFFQKAEKVVNNAQNANERGWRAGESTSRRNRYWLINNILNDEYAPVREFIYVYHREGLDMMHDKVVDARSRIAESLTLLQSVQRNRPDPFMHFFQVIMDAKSDEFVNVFQGSMDDEKRRVTALLNQIDPTNGDKYRKIMASSR
jgi:hypothetical protein